MSSNVHESGRAPFAEVAHLTADLAEKARSGSRACICYRFSS
jgi:hypothetical protein